MTGIRFNPLTGQWAAVLDADPFSPSAVQGVEKVLVECLTVTNAAQNLLWALSQRLAGESNVLLPTLSQAEHAAREALTRAEMRSHLQGRGVDLDGIGGAL